MLDADEATKPAESLLVFRDEDGEVARAFVEAVADAVHRDDGPGVRGLVSELHEADQGALLEALDQEDRLKLIALLGDDFDFAALTEVDDAVREEILDELPTETVVEGVRDLESDDAVYILGGPRQGRPGRDPGRAAADRSRGAAKEPRLSRGLGRPPDADGPDRGAALLDGGADDRSSPRSTTTCRTASSRCSWSIPAIGCSVTCSSTGLVRSGREEPVDRSWPRTAAA